MEELDIDLTSVSAYSDASHARDRELWRGFLSYALPVIMANEVENLDQQLADAVVYSFEELTTFSPKMDVKGGAIRSISTLLAKEIGVAPEFALAAFFEGGVPTKLYKVKQTSLKKNMKVQQEDKMIGTWLADLAKVQEDKKFIKNVETWKKWLVDRESFSKAG